MGFRSWGPAFALVALVWGCRQETGRLGPGQEQRFAAEGILHRADNLRFRWTAGAGRRGGTWEDRLASIVVTRQSLLIHKNEKVGVEVTPGRGRGYEVHRDGERVRISVGSGRSLETWSFVPPDSPDAWTQDIRAVIRGATANPAGRR
ncbi:MAG TPA: hypothetical protein VE091_11625 [Gemmatimonadales bacterium]|jgi:hypothetical protein|nr:hypothetical protein [Gemmatimonadales bacterium]